MADIELVIKIPEEYYKSIKEIPVEQSTADMLIIKNGTPLPQPFDLEGLKKDMKALNCGFPYGLDYLLDCLDKRLGIKIAEADKGEDKE